MSSYVIGLFAILLLYNPLVQYLSPQPAKIPRTPRPAINESLLAIDSSGDTVPVCKLDAYAVHILSKAPLVVYIENFVSADERRHLLELR